MTRWDKFVIFDMADENAGAFIFEIFNSYTRGKIQTQKGSNERLFILTRTHSRQIVGEIPFIESQNDT